MATPSTFSLSSQRSILWIQVFFWVCLFLMCAAGIFSGLYILNFHMSELIHAFVSLAAAVLLTVFIYQTSYESYGYPRHLGRFYIQELSPDRKKSGPYWRMKSPGIWYLREPKQWFTRYRVLIVGEPGCGKTAVARALKGIFMVEPPESRLAGVADIETPGFDGRGYAIRLLQKEAEDRLPFELRDVSCILFPINSTQASEAAIAAIETSMRKIRRTDCYHSILFLLVDYTLELGHPAPNRAAEFQELQAKYSIHYCSANLTDPPAPFRESVLDFVEMNPPSHLLAYDPVPPLRRP